MSYIRLPLFNFSFDRSFRYAWIFFIIKIILIVPLWFWSGGLNLGIDFQGGLIVELRFHPQVSWNMADVRMRCANLTQQDGIILQTGQTPQDVSLRFQTPAHENQIEQTMQKIRQEFDGQAIVRSTSLIGPKMSHQILINGITGIVLGLMAMGLYIVFRFSRHFALSAIVALCHDVIVIILYYLISRHTFTETSLVAILITISYSINDTVVIFDRIREHMRNASLQPSMINLSINETLARTVLTSLTTLAALVMLYFFGGPVLAHFSLPMIVGLVAGTYSSIFIATSMLSFIGKQHEK